MAIPVRVIEMTQGEDRTTEFTVTPVENITGWTISMFVEFASSTLTKPGVIVDALAGKFSVTIARADTQLIPAGDYEYEAWRVDPAQNRVLVEGTLVLLDTVRP